MELSPLPVIGLFLSHFDDIKGQCVVYYKAKDEELLPPGQIEHSTLASGLHLLSTDLVLFAHCGFPAAGLFRSRHTGEVGRGRRMGTVGVILGPPATTDTLFSCRELLEGLYDDLEDNSTSLFNDPSTIEKMDAIWRELTSSKASSSTSSLVMQLDSRDEARRIRGLVEGRIKPEAHHPLVYLPSLLSLLGPSIVVVYKAAIAGRRILLYSPPPLVPLSAFAWCIQAMSIPPAGSSAGSSFSTWIGNAGLMDLDSVKQRRGGWIGTTSDSIFRSHQKCYDLFIDLSSPTPANDSKTPVAPDSPLQSRNTPTSLIETDSDPTLLVPNPAGGNAEPISITYSFSDLAHYRSLLLLEASPSSITTTSMDRFENGIPTGVMSKKGGMWLLAFELYERLYKLCVGVCEFATGRGYTSDPDHPTLGGGAIRLGDGEEDARLLDLEDVEDPDGSVAQPETTISQPGHTEEDEAVRIGILMLRQLHHHTYHLHHKLKTVRKSLHGAELTQDELKELIGKKITWGGDLRQSIQGKWWIDLARTWDVVVTGDEDE